ncbi:uncharacterized protein LOC120441095 [Oreochromis aureus]|uniref:uncharacterized protein LOC120441095 n=1 Tax=Oreochromis aureus TaxID=47969 RepID=UPI0019533308|nr:uncharacterized protein LOC120441095 [Oreochromis aureus]
MAINYSVPQIQFAAAQSDDETVNMCNLEVVRDGNRPKNLNDTITPELGKDFHSDCRMQSQEETELIQRTGEPVELPEGETPASLEEKKHILLTIFNSEGPGAVERPDVDDFMCLTYISQRQLINSCPSLSVAEIQEQWPFLFTRKGLSNHFYKLTGIDISERLSQALITKGRRIINYFSSQKLKCNLGIRTLLQQMESEGVLANNKIGTAAILLMMKYYKEDEDSLFVLADETSTRMSLEAESNLPITPRLIMLGQSSMTATCWMVSAEGRVIVELDKENTFADAMSSLVHSMY